MREARERAQLDPGAWALALAPMTGWTAPVEVVHQWETTVAAPGQVVVAAEVLAPPVPGAAPVGAGTLGTVPHSFTAGELTGAWVTCYQFSDPPKFHADISTLAAVTERHIRAVNYPPQPRTQGHASPYRNEITAELAGRHLAGSWRNASDARYFGTIHLAVLPGETVMEGYYTGLVSDVAVGTGFWKWARLETGPLKAADLAAVSLRDPAELHALLARHSQYDAPLTLADVGEAA